MPTHLHLLAVLRITSVITIVSITQARYKFSYFRTSYFWPRTFSGRTISSFMTKLINDIVAKLVVWVLACDLFWIGSFFIDVAFQGLYWKGKWYNWIQWYLTMLTHIIYKLLPYHLRITIYTFEIFISFFCFVVYLFIHKVIFQLWRNCDKTDDSLESMKKYYQIHTLVTEMTKSCSSKLKFNYGNDRILYILWKYFQN